MTHEPQPRKASGEKVFGGVFPGVLGVCGGRGRRMGG